MTQPAGSQMPRATDEGTSFAETALKLGGKSADEAKRTGQIDRADDQVEHLFQAQYQTVNSPVHRAVWDRKFPIELFQAKGIEPPPRVAKVMFESTEVVRRHRTAGTILDENRKISSQVLRELGEVGYWGLLVDTEYGGSGAPFRTFAPFLTRMAMEDPTIAGLASVHGCIGAVDPVRTFGNSSQKARFLPQLASGARLSAFALTEPCAGSDLTALRTVAKRRGDHFFVTGEKLFITNAGPGRTIGLVCLIENTPAVLICDLPDQETPEFQIKRYGLWALKHAHNVGLIFKDFAVPVDNYLDPGQGNGLTIAYHGLNLGRVALCAGAAGTMRHMLSSMLPWAKFRVTYGEAIAKRELVRRRLGRLAGLIVACDALVEWCSWLLDEGYRGEMECIIAKIFGSEAQKEAAIELCMKTHGGRSFLQGHLFGENVHEFLAPCIYEGEGEMLGMAFFKSLVKHHGTQFFEPVGKALQQAGIRSLNPMNPSHLWALREAMPPYVKWWALESLTPKAAPQLPSMPEPLRNLASWAFDRLQSTALEVSGTMRKHQLKLADRQCRMAELSGRIQSLIVVLCTTLYASRRQDKIIQDAAAIIGRDLQRQYNGERPSDRDLRATTALGEALIAGGASSLSADAPSDILMSY
jgi:alkylation response protein AidB-like acyl-CoA dehydrogenase